MTEDDSKTTRAYLGDGLYADYDGFQIRLWASDGVTMTNEVFLDPYVLQNLIIFAERLRAEQEAVS